MTEFDNMQYVVICQPSCLKIRKMSKFDNLQHLFFGSIAIQPPDLNKKLRVFESNVGYEFDKRQYVKIGQPAASFVLSTDVRFYRVSCFKKNMYMNMYNVV